LTAQKLCKPPMVMRLMVLVKFDLFVRLLLNGSEANI
jgi:hypothetical protein